jgi:hypothetical protein
VELRLHFSIYLQNEYVIINNEMRFGKGHIRGLPGGVTGIFSGSTQENSDGIATLCFNEGCPVVLFK